MYTNQAAEKNGKLVGTSEKGAKKFIRWKFFRIVCCVWPPST